MPRMVLAVLLSAVLALGAMPVIIDTDAGSDDLMAIAFLLGRKDVRIEAVTIANGLAHVPKGGENVLRLLQLAGRGEIPVYLGSETPFLKTGEFPEAWRRIADTLPGVQLAPAIRSPERRPAAEFLASRLMDASRPVNVLALGPLTNLARAFQREPACAVHIRRLVIMGGAVSVPGNLGDGGLFKTKNTTAEWNIFVDPRAAQIVFLSGANIQLITLDATSRVPIGMPFMKDFKERARTPLASFVAQVLESDRESIQGGYFQAWDPLAAVSLTNPATVTFTRARIQVDDQGRTVLSHATPNAQVALDADAALFKQLFVDSFR